MADSGFDLTRNAEAARCVLGEDRRGQAIVAVVGETDRVSFILGTDHGDDRAEALIAVEVHGGSHAIDNRSRHQHGVSRAA